MNVEARSQTIESIFKKGQYIIPDYQREYDWTKENLEEFLEDIESSEEKHYFIGHMVCEGNYNGDKFKVIDGQQRITTITIMLSVIRDLFYERGLYNLVNGLHEKYIFAKDKDYNEYVILKNDIPYPVLQKYVQSKPDAKDKNIEPQKNGEKKIINAYNYFYEKWKEQDEEKLKILRDKILDLEIIFVAVDDEVDAFTVFETLNAKGKDLTPLDLIKNQVFKNYQGQPHINEPNDSWKKIVENSKKDNLKFLNNFWASRYKKVSDRKIYKEFTNESKKEQFDYNDFVKNLLNDSILFKRITEPNISHWSNEKFRIYLSLNALKIFNIKVVYSFLLSLLREYLQKNISLKYTIKALVAIEMFHFINNAVIGGRSSGLDSKYSKYAIKLFNENGKQKKHTIIDALIKELQNKLPPKEQFEAKFDDRLYYSKTDEKYKKLVQYALKKIEYEEQNYNIDLMNISLEHIYPEKFGKCWESLDEKYIKNKYIKNIGNIVLLDRDINSNIGNKCFEDKKEIILKKSTLLSTRQVFINNDLWNKDKILERRGKLLEKLYKNGRLS